MPKRSRNRLKFRFQVKYLLVGIALSIVLLVSVGWSNPSIATKVAFKTSEDIVVSDLWGKSLQDASICGLAEPKSENKLVKAITPSTNIGFTVTSHPSIFIYVPQTEAQRGFFSIQDEESNYYYQTSISLPKQSGVIEVGLPDDAPALEVGKNYKWSLGVICHQYLEADSPFVTGWIRRIETSKAIVHSSPSQISVDMLNKLAADGVWYDTISTMAKLRRQYPSNQKLVASWERLLKSSELNAIADQPLLY
jgi:hypothetical protein